MVTSELLEYGFAAYNNASDRSKGMHFTQVGRDYAAKRAGENPPTAQGFSPIPAK